MSFQTMSTQSFSNEAPENSPYVSFVNLTERLHKNIIEVIRDQFVRSGFEDVNPIHALLIYRITANGALTSELRNKTGKTGNNVSYTLKKLAAKGYIEYHKSNLDRRSVKIYLTKKGRNIRVLIDEIFTKHISNMKEVAGITPEDLLTAVAVMKKMDSFWMDNVLYKL